MSEKSKVYVGIDVHRLMHYAAIVSREMLEARGQRWQEAKSMTLTNCHSDFDKLDQAIREHAISSEEVSIAVDQTGRYSEPLVYFLQSKGYQVYFVDSKAVRGIEKYILSKEDKTDVSDAAAFAYLLYLNNEHSLPFRFTRVVTDFSSKGTVLRTLVLQLSMYRKLILQATLRLRQLLYVVFPEAERKDFVYLLRLAAEFPTPRDLLNAAENGRPIPLGRKKRAEILSLAANTIGVPGDVYRDLIRYLALFRSSTVEKRDALIAEITKAVDSHPYGRILLSFPMFGHASAALLIGIVKHIDRWSSDRKLKKALGVYPAINQSGTTLSRRNLGRGGDSDARSKLFMVAMSCLTPSAPPNDFHDYYLCQVAKGKPKKKALVNTAGKLAEVIFHCLKEGKPYQYQGVYRKHMQSTSFRKRSLPASLRQESGKDASEGALIPFNNWLIRSDRTKEC